MIKLVKAKDIAYEKIRDMQQHMQTRLLTTFTPAIQANTNQNAKGEPSS